METINGIPLRNFGLVVQSMQGILDMPKREGDTFYDWGNGYEPLVSEDDIYFGSRRIEMDAFYDERKHSDFEAAMNELRGMTEEVPLVTAYGTTPVRVHEVRQVKSYKGGKTLKITFIELNPDLSGGLPNASNDSAAVRIDGHDMFATFGMLVESVKLYDVEKLKENQQTRNKTNLISVWREPQHIEVKINGIYANKSDMATKISALNALLAKPGLRHFVYRGDGFQCFSDEGCKVTIYRSRVQLNLKLKVMAYYNYDEIVQRVIDEANIQVNPQSDLLETDSSKPAFIKGKDTFVAADSKKLDGKASGHFAKESEIAEAREVDLATELENLTTEI